MQQIAGVVTAISGRVPIVGVSAFGQRRTLHFSFYSDPKYPQISSQISLGSVRLTLGRGTKGDEIKIAAQALVRAFKTLNQ